MKNVRHGPIWIIAAIMLGLATSTPAAANECVIWDDFNDGNADGWSFDWINDPGNVSFPEEDCREKYLRMDWQTGVAGFYLRKEDFSFCTSNIVVEFDARASTSNGHIETEQFLDADNYAHDTLRFSGYHDSYSRHEVNDILSCGDYGYPPLDRTTWTRFRIEWSAGAVHTMSFTEKFDHDCLPVADSWQLWYSHDHDMPDLPLGSSFRIYFGGSDTAAVYDLDNVCVTPEPATLSLLALGGLAILRRRRIPC
ncbi:MAG: PEP-CTERM sorting domain-containing protein [Phycisphaerae bacterium]|nr:PEP-CTERM sorting domain-containing protein [Phycisphaerae bacterium]